MSNSKDKSHQATEVRLRNRRSVNRPHRPIAKSAIEVGSGTGGTEYPWSMIETLAPLLPPTRIRSFSTIREFTPAKLMVSEVLPGGLEVNSVPTTVPVASLKSVSPTDAVPVPPKVLKRPDRVASVNVTPAG